MKMSFFDVLTLIGGLCLFLYGMNIMGDGLERCAGSKLNEIIGRLTTNKLAGFLTGLGVTAIIQSSSATTVMVVGFVNSGIMSLKQSISVIMGANIGTTITAWILSLGGIESDNFWVQLFKPMSFTPILALIGIIFFMFGKNHKKKDTGTIFLGFAVLMFGMDIMSNAVAGLKDVPEFRELFVMFSNPILGVLAGAVLTAIIQSSSASVGILQALTVTGQITYGAALPIIMGQNIGTCVTAILSSFGTNRNAKRVALAHLSFNVIGTTILMVVLYAVRFVAAPAILDESASHFGVAVAHSLFNVICTIVLLPMSELLEKIVCKLVPDTKEPEIVTELDDRLLVTPTIALNTCQKCTVEMAKSAMESLNESMTLLYNFSPDKVDKIREIEEKTDHYEDVIGNYLIKLSSCSLNEKESAEAAKLLHVINDIERIADHAVNILESAEELQEKKLTFTGRADAELKILLEAVSEISAMTLQGLEKEYAICILDIEPLEEVIDMLKEKLRMNHTIRLQQGECSAEVGFVWIDLLTNLERVSDHCSNIAGCIIEASHNEMNLHEGLRKLKFNNDVFETKYNMYLRKYAIK